jgi:hypothetical protein
MALDRLAFHRPPALKPALRPVVLAYPACYIRPKFAANASPAYPLKILRDTFVRSPLALLSQIANRQSVSKASLTPPEPFTSHSHEAPVTFLPAPLFSYSYELLFPQALCFDNHPHCPGVWGWERLLVFRPFSAASVSPWQIHSFHTIANSSASAKNSTPLQSSKSKLFRKNTEVWHPPAFLADTRVGASRLTNSPLDPYLQRSWIAICLSQVAS